MFNHETLDRKDQKMKINYVKIFIMLQD